MRTGLRSFCKRKSAFDQYYCWILRSLKTQFYPLINQSKSPFVAPKPFDKLIATKTTKKQHLAQVQFNNKFPNPNIKKPITNSQISQRKKINKSIPCKSRFLEMQNKKKKNQNIAKSSLMQYLPFVCFALIQTIVNDKRQAYINPDLKGCLSCSKVYIVWSHNCIGFYKVRGGFRVSHI